VKKLLPFVTSSPGWILLSPLVNPSYTNLALYLYTLGRNEDAVGVGQEANGLYRKVVETDPGLESDLASSLYFEGIILSIIGRHERLPRH
jgi:hypothetical protein